MTEKTALAKELGLSPRSLMKSVPSKSQPWKAPVHVWIRDMYEEKHEKAVQEKVRKQVEQMEGQPPQSPQHALPDRDPASVQPAQHRRLKPPLHPEVKCEHSDDFDILDDTDLDEDESEEFEESWYNDDPPDDTAIEQQNQAMLRRQQKLRIAAEYVAKTLARLRQRSISASMTRLG